jgi:hypothetical protein
MRTRVGDDIGMMRKGSMFGEARIMGAMEVGSCENPLK